MENKRKFTKQEIGTLAIAIAAIMIVIGGVSYSYFSVTILGNENATSTIITTAKLDIDFVSTDYFNNTNMMLVKDSERETKADAISFSVKHKPTSTIAVNYNVYLAELSISNNFKSADFKWELLKNNTVIASGNFASVGNATELKLTSTALSLPLANTDNLILRAWLSETAVDQSSLYNGSFQAKVSIQATV